MGLMKTLFDFSSIKNLVNDKTGKKFPILIDGMHGAVGPYAVRLAEMLDSPLVTLMRCNPLEDFGGCHPDPNLTYAPELVKALGLSENS